ncbi:ABC transporter permease [Paenibacillus gorillae]|uniref:ABC transporter permease n=1 Tax=Paenibacillus gorillae TaxID=1243662 RepID=UPI0004B421F3|nr:ABC transporter permease [Paenibacillus gorillae]
MFTIFKTMLAGIFRDGHTLFWTILFPLAMLAGLGLYFDNQAYSERLLGGVLTTNVLFGSAMVTAFNVMAQRNRGVYKLLRATPFKTSAFITAMTGARTALTLIVSGCVILMGVIILGVSLHALSLLMMLIVLLAGTVCFTAIGFIAANLSRDESNVNMISNLISFPMLFTSEAFYSLQNAPGWVQLLGKLQPFSYFVEAMSIAISPEGAFADIVMPLLILIGFCILCLAVAILTFRWDSERAAGRRFRQKQTSSY